MVDARLPERYLNDRRVARLSADEFRSFAMALLWSVSNRTDGRIELDDLALIPQFRGTASPLVDAGLWELAPDAKGWIIVDFNTTQTSAEDLAVLDNARRADREKKARQRAHNRGDHSRCGSECENGGGRPHFTASPGDSQGDGPGDVSRVQDRRGQDRQVPEESSWSEDVPVDGTTGEVGEGVVPQTIASPADEPPVLAAGGRFERDGNTMRWVEG